MSRFIFQIFSFIIFDMIEKIFYRFIKPSCGSRIFPDGGETNKEKVLLFHQVCPKPALKYKIGLNGVGDMRSCSLLNLAIGSFIVN